MGAALVLEGAMKPVIGITHAAFDHDRRRTLQALTDQLVKLAPELEFFVQHDSDRIGSLGCWLEALRRFLATDGTHFVWLPDDAVLCDRFGKSLLAAIRARPEDVFDCYLVHPDCASAPGKWYRTHEGFVGLGGVIPRKDVEAILDWRNAAPNRLQIPNDECVNFWAMEIGRPVFKTGVSLVDHIDSVPSLEKHPDVSLNGRRALHFAPDGHVEWSAEVVDTLGTCPWRRAHWEAMAAQPMTVESIAHAYEIDRGRPVSQSTEVVIVTPAYQALEIGYVRSRDAVMNDLILNGMSASFILTPGDSLVTRGRHTCMHHFLQTDATHMLFWDADVECMTPACVRAMLASGHDVVAGLYPFRDGSKKVVGNLRISDLIARNVECDETGCVPVSEAGTGFLLISRKALLAMCERYPETFYWSDCGDMFGRPMWALFDVAIRDKRYLSEDWLFCHRWQEMGGTVFAYLTATFRHWGKQAYDGNLLEAFGLRKRT